MIVLTVDDSELNLAVYSGVLSRIQDVEVVCFSAPLQALGWVSEHHADVVVVDYHMPELDGLQFIERFRRLQDGEQALIVMVTADEDRGVRHKALQAGANDFLTKPLDRVEFNARMQNLLALAKSRQQLADRAQWLRDEVLRATSALVVREIETIVRLTRAAEFRDDATGMHVIRVGHMCAALAKRAGFDDEECKKVLFAAPMHDIGKVATPDGILLKPGPLTDDELAVMRRHTIAGYEILRGSESEMLRCAAEIALTHHERWDGSGYPYGVAGAAIPMSGRLCSVTDVFDALTSERPYKEAWSIDRAAETVRAGSGTQFDPAIVEIFESSLGEILAIKQRFADNAPNVESLKSALI